MCTYVSGLVNAIKNSNKTVYLYVYLPTRIHVHVQHFLETNRIILLLPFRFRYKPNLPDGNKIILFVNNNNKEIKYKYREITVICSKSYNKRGRIQLC